MGSDGLEHSVFGHDKEGPEDRRCRHGVEVIYDFVCHTGSADFNDEAALVPQLWIFSLIGSELFRAVS